jgi:hypothetical protein
MRDQTSRNRGSIFARSASTRILINTIALPIIRITPSTRHHGVPLKHCECCKVQYGCLAVQSTASLQLNKLVNAAYSDMRTPLLKYSSAKTR